MSSVFEPVDDDIEWREWKERKERKERTEWNEWKNRKQLEEEEALQEPIQETPETEPAFQVVQQSRSEYAPSDDRSTGWSGVYKAIRDYDEETLKNYQDDVDNLLVFAGLFSAILTALIIEAYPRLLADTSGRGSSDSGQQIASRTAYKGSRGLYSAVTAAAASTSTSTSFQPSPLDIRINVLWFTSLLLSLISASFGILVKQWLREYTAFTNPSPKARLRIRHMRFPALAAWKVFKIAAFLPVLVHLALALFFIGLIYFTESIHSSIEYTTLPLVSAWGLCFVSFAGLPFFFPHCPYHTTILKDVYSWFHRAIGRLPKPPTSDQIRVRHKHIGKVNWLYAPWVRIFGGIVDACDRTDEIKLALVEHGDLEVLSAADATQANDELLTTEVVDAAHQVDLKKTPLHAAPGFIYNLLRNRLALPQGDDGDGFGIILDLRETTLSPKAQCAIINIVLHFIQTLSHRNKEHPGLIPILQGTRREVDILQPQLLFVLLLLLSGHHIGEHRSIVHDLSQLSREPAIVSICRRVAQSPSGIGIKRDGYQDARSTNKMRVNLLRGILLIHEAVNAQWSLTLVMRSIGSVSQFYPELDDPTKIPNALHTLDRAQKLLTSLGSRAMHYVVTLDRWAGGLDRAVVQGVLKCLYSEVRKRMEDSSCSDKIPFQRPQVPGAADILGVDLIALDSLVTYISFQSWRPQWFRLENLWSNFLPSHVGETESRTFALAICAVPTIGILRLCWRAASHSHSSGRQVIMGMNVETLSNWGKILQYGLQCDLVRSDATHILKLLSFSVYLYTFGTPRLWKIDDEEQQAWKSIFGLFAASLERFNSLELQCDGIVCHRPKPMTTLATVCFEVIRFEAIFARIMRHHAENPSHEQPKDYSAFRYTFGRTVDATLILDWKAGLLEPGSVFSAGLIHALERLAEPFWDRSLQDKPMSRQEHSSETINFRDVCVAYEERIQYQVKIKAGDTVKWLRGHCGCRTFPEAKRGRLQTMNDFILAPVRRIWSICSPRRRDSPPHGDVEMESV